MLHIVHFLPQSLGIVDGQLVLLVLLLEKHIDGVIIILGRHLVAPAHLRHQHQHASEVYKSPDIEHVFRCGKRRLGGDETDVTHDKSADTGSQHADQLLGGHVQVALGWHVSPLEVKIHHIGQGEHHQHHGKRQYQTLQIQNPNRPHMKLLVQAGRKLRQNKGMRGDDTAVLRLDIQYQI